MKQFNEEHRVNIGIGFGKRSVVFDMNVNYDQLMFLKKFKKCFNEAKGNDPSKLMIIHDTLQLQRKYNRLVEELENIIQILQDENEKLAEEKNELDMEMPDFVREKEYSIRREKMIETRNKIYKRFGGRGKTEAKKVIANARKKYLK